MSNKRSIHKESWYSLPIFRNRPALFDFRFFIEKFIAERLDYINCLKLSITIISALFKNAAHSNCIIKPIQHPKSQPLALPKKFWYRLKVSLPSNSPSIIMWAFLNGKRVMFSFTIGALLFKPSHHPWMNKLVFLPTYK